MVEVGQGSAYNDNSQVSKNYSYGTKNYLGKNPMTRTQWRRFQRKKKPEAEATTSSSSSKFPSLTRAQVEMKPMENRLCPPVPPIKEKEKVPDSTEDTDMLTYNFD